MTSAEIESEVVAIIADISGHGEEEITAQANFYEDLEVDSIKSIEITVALEKKFRISVRDEDVPNIRTVRQAVELISKLLEQKR
jgi:acyl carrier protein